MQPREKVEVLSLGASIALGLSEYLALCIGKGFGGGWGGALPLYKVSLE